MIKPKIPYKTHLPCHICGLKAADGWEYQDSKGTICDVCAGVL